MHLSFLDIGVPLRTTADIYSHAIRGNDHAAALRWDNIMQEARDRNPPA